MSSETTLPLKPNGTLKSSLKSSKKKTGTVVSFADIPQVHELPEDDAEDAQNTRKGSWGAAPDHDELWDGFSRKFWSEEKTLEEVHRIIVIRGMRLALQYNLGFGFYAMVANFMKRKPKVENPTGPQMLHEDLYAIVPQFETPEAEETALRKEIRELFADSVKGLDFDDLIQDRAAFDKLYLGTILSPAESRGFPGLGLKKIEQIVDEIMNCEDLCQKLGVEYIAEPIPEKGKQEKEVFEKAMNQEEKKRGDRRASLELLNNGIPPFGERRASIEAKRRSSMESSITGSDATKRTSLDSSGIKFDQSSNVEPAPSQSALRKSLWENNSVAENNQAPSLGFRRGSAEPKRASLQTPKLPIDENLLSNASKAPEGRLSIEPNATRRSSKEVFTPIIKNNAESNTTEVAVSQKQLNLELENVTPIEADSDTNSSKSTPKQSASDENKIKYTTEPAAGKDNAAFILNGILGLFVLLLYYLFRRLTALSSIWLFVFIVTLILIGAVIFVHNHNNIKQ